MTRAQLGTPEFALLFGCCRSSFANAGGAAPGLAADVDWPRFVRLARFHRVQGLVWQGLGPQPDALPNDAKEALSSDARSIAATNLAIARECGDLRDRFDRAGIPLLFVKGLTVAALAYRSPMLKMGWDIDLLIDPGDLAAAAELLAECGYSPRLPSDPKQLRSWHARSKESVWNRADAFHVELHTRLADNRRLLPSVGVNSPSQLVEIAPGVSLATLRLDELFAYLCVHGASSAWFRLKWITDLAAILSQHDSEEIERLYRRALELSTGRTAAQALLLADALYGSLEGSGLRATLGKSRANRRLAALALALLCQAEPKEPTSAWLGTWRIHLNQLLMGGGPGFALSDLWRQLADASFSRLGK